VSLLLLGIIVCCCGACTKLGAAARQRFHRRPFVSARRPSNPPPAPYQQQVAPSPRDPYARVNNPAPSPSPRYYSGPYAHPVPSPVPLGSYAFQQPASSPVLPQQPPNTPVEDKRQSQYGGDVSLREYLNHNQNPTQNKPQES
jgi:hypothetical protein